MKKGILVLLVLLMVSFGVFSSPKENKSLNIAKADIMQSYKVKAVHFNGNSIQAQAMLEKVIVEEAAGEWVYDSYVDLKNENTDAKLLVFKRVTKGK